MSGPRRRLAAVLLAALGGCAGGATPIREILDNPARFDGQRATVAAGIGKMWLDDSEAMPIKPVDPPAERNLSKGVRVDAVAMDNCFDGWSRKAVIEWPEWTARLTLSAESPLDFLVVYTPPKQDFFCVEPVTHAPDAVNNVTAGRTDTGLQVLEQGKTMRVTVRFNIEEL